MARAENRFRSPLAAGLSLVAMLVAPPVLASARPSAGFPAHYDAGGQRLELRGSGKLRWRGLLDVYAAALYLPPGLPASAVLDDVPRRLEIVYFRTLEAGDFARAAERLLGERLPPSGLAALRPRLERLHARYESVEPGDRYALTYQPGSGMELSKNGQALIVIPGADFAAAYFAMWLGNEPIDRQLRESLLALSTMRARE